MKILINLIGGLILASCMVNVAAATEKDIDDAVEHVQTVKKKLKPLAEMQSAHINSEIEKIIEDPNYIQNFINASVKKELVPLVKQSISYRQKTTEPVNANIPSCSQAKEKYRTTSLTQLQQALDQYKTTDTAPSDIAQVLIGTLSIDGANFIAGPITACHKR